MDIKLKINSVYYSGGYGFVFVAQDTSTGKEYALKVTRSLNSF